MPNACCAPDCRVGYKDTKKKKEEEIENDHPQSVIEKPAGETSDETPQETPNIATFGFPKHDKEPELRARWIARVPRNDRRWITKSADVTAKLYLCEKHFMPEDIISDSTDTNSRRKRKSDQLCKKRVKPGALPCLWPRADHLSKPTTPRPTTLATSEARFENAQRIQQEIDDERIAQDTFNSLEELNEKETGLNIPSGTLKQMTDNSILYINIETEDAPKIRYSVRISSDLSVETYYKQQRLEEIPFVNTLSAMNEIFQDLEDIIESPFTDQDIIDQIISKLKDQRFQKYRKVAFILEQLTLLFKKPNARRYSPELLAMCALIQSISPACYKQLHRDSFLTLPCPGHLKRLSSAINVDTMTLSESCVAYITARYKKISELERLVSVLVDEVYSHQSVQYVNGQFFGAENGLITKTMLCVMLKSVAGKYRDIVAMVPIVNISAEKLYAIWVDVIEKISKIGFDPAVTMSDGHSSNMNLFNNKILKSASDLSVPNPSAPTSLIFPFYDNTHLFKNFYNNWNNYKTFKCPLMEPREGKTVISPSFHVLRQLYQLEKSKPIRMAHKLTEQVLNPKSIEKTNVKLADAAFHESTYNALQYYSSNGYPQFEDTAIFVKYVRDWFNTVNVKSTDYGKRARDDRRNPIRRESVKDDLSYLSKFHDWLKRWKDGKGMKGLSSQTFECAIRSCAAIIALVPYLFENNPLLKYVLLGFICSDFLEGRFGWWRQLCGGNYYNAVLQFLQAEKTIRLRCLVEMGYNMAEIKEIFVDASNKQSLQKKEEIKSFLSEFDDFWFTDDSMLSDADKSIIYYVAGYIAKSVISECEQCNEVVSPGKVPLTISIESASEEDVSMIEAKEEFIAAVSRGGLMKPSNYLYMAAVNATVMYNYIRNDNELFKSLLATENPRDTFIECYLSLTENDSNSSELLKVKCSKGHLHDKHVRRTAFTVFNISAKNFAAQKNDEIRNTKKTHAGNVKRSQPARKIKKVQSN